MLFVDFLKLFCDSFEHSIAFDLWNFKVSRHNDSYFKQQMFLQFSERVANSAARVIANHHTLIIIKQNLNQKLFLRLITSIKLKLAKYLQKFELLIKMLEFFLFVINFHLAHKVRNNNGLQNFEKRRFICNKSNNFKFLFER